MRYTYIGSKGKCLNSSYLLLTINYTFDIVIKRELNVVINTDFDVWFISIIHIRYNS